MAAQMTPSSQLRTKDRRLIAVGAGLASGCVPRTERHAAVVKRAGARSAMIRQTGAREVDEAASRLLGSNDDGGENDA